MIIGLIRHFKVDLPFRKSGYLPSEFNEQMASYDSAPVIPNELNMTGYEWDICYSSNLPRAVITAKAVYEENIIQTSLLREVPIRSFTKRNWKLPSVLWHIGGRIAWRKNSKTQPENYLETQQRIDDLYDLISSNGYSNILLVTHGFFMRILTTELRKKGYKGNLDFSPVNGKLYIFEK